MKWDNPLKSLNVYDDVSGLSIPHTILSHAGQFIQAETKIYHKAANQTKQPTNQYAMNNIPNQKKQCI